MKGLKLLTCSVIALCAAAFTAPAAQAQSVIGFGVLAGGTIPTGDLGKEFRTGWHVGGLLNWEYPRSSVAFRGEAVYDNLGAKGGINDTFTMMSGTANIVWSPSPRKSDAISPYFIGGAGYYHEKEDAGGLTATLNKPGFNAGVGLNLPLGTLNSGVEARYHVILDSQNGYSNTSFLRASFFLRF
jgi:hypothetical protein